jgi:hypothetical protein
MKRFLDEKINEAKFAKNYGVDGYEVVGKKNLEEMQSVYDLYFNPNQSTFLDDKYIVLDTKIDEDYFAFIQRLLTICANTPLLETEATINYPDLYSTKKMSNDDIYRFVNTVHRTENPSLSDNLVSINNFRIFRSSFFNKIKTNRGKAVVYRNHIDGRKEMLLVRDDTIRDFLSSTGNAVELYQQVDDKYSHALNVMKYFMKNRAVSYWQGNEANKQQLIEFDNIVYHSRSYANAINNMTLEEFNALPAAARINILELIDKTLGYALSFNRSINLQTLMKSDIMTGSGANLESIDSSYEEVEGYITNASNKLLERASHEFTRKK